MSDFRRGCENGAATKFLFADFSLTPALSRWERGPRQAALVALERVGLLLKTDGDSSLSQRERAGVREKPAHRIWRNESAQCSAPEIRHQPFFPEPPRA